MLHGLGGKEQEHLVQLPIFLILILEDLAAKHAVPNMCKLALFVTFLPA